MKTILHHAEAGQYGLFIDGDYVPGSARQYVDSINPARNTTWYTITDAGHADVDQAVAAAARALRNPAWRSLTQTARGGLIRRLGDLLAVHGERLAEIETRDNGKLIREMRAQMASLPDTYYYHAGMADKLTGETIPVNKTDTFNFTLREPIGVVAIIVPWNSPLYLLSSVLAPCLAVGNTVVVKPAENTTASTLEFAALVRESGIPDGVFNVVTGLGETAGEALVRHPGISKVAFTGGTETGRKIARNAAENLVPCTLELGGKSPHVVFDDSDPERAASGIVSGIFAAGGQTCIAGSRCFLQEAIYDTVLDLLVQKARAVVVGDPMDPQTQLGPLALHSQLDKVKDHIRTARQDGATLVTGGRQPVGEGCAEGLYIEPTVFTEVTRDMRLAREEIFGPVLAVMPFSDEAELIRKANDTVYGLAAGIWTRDIDRALRFARDVDAGTIWINTYRNASFLSPFGGFKQSGYGKHNGMEGIREYSRLKNVLVDYSGQTPDPFVMKLG